MYSPRDEPPAIEKIRKPQWTVENTRATQAVVDELVRVGDAIRTVIGRPSTGLSSPTMDAIEGAITRFMQLDPKVHT